MSNKAIVETVGDHMYIDPTNGQVIEHDRPTVVTLTPFVSQKIADGEIKLLTPNLPKQASDEDFLKTHVEFAGNDNGKNSAVASYAAEFGLDETGNTLPDGSAQRIKNETKAKETAKAEQDARKNDPVVAAANFGKDTVTGGNDTVDGAAGNDTLAGAQVTEAKTVGTGKAVNAKK